MKRDRSGLSYVMKTNQGKLLDVYAVGNALVDIPATVDDAFLERHGLAKGGMTLVETDRRGHLLDDLKRQTLHPKCGGSAANTAIAVAQSGGSGIFVGKVSADAHGALYGADMRASGLEYDARPTALADGPTGTSIILTTPDAERTMCTHLGVSVLLGADDIDPEAVARCRICYVEGYLWSGDATRAASLKALEAAGKSGAIRAFTFSDRFLVNLFAADFRGLLREHCDLMFCNADEARAFCGQDSLRDCAELFSSLVRRAFITDGKEGCLVVDEGKVVPVPGFAADAIDTVGAGDAFAGGVLYGLAHGFAPVKAARWGNYLASQVVQIRGPRLASVSLEKKVGILSAG